MDLCGLRGGRKLGDGRGARWGGDVEKVRLPRKGFRGDK